MALEVASALAYLHSRAQVIVHQVRTIESISMSCNHMLPGSSWDCALLHVASLLLPLLPLLQLVLPAMAASNMAAIDSASLGHNSCCRMSRAITYYCRTALPSWLMSVSGWASQLYALGGTRRCALSQVCTLSNGASSTGSPQSSVLLLNNKLGCRPCKGTVPHAQVKTRGMLSTTISCLSSSVLVSSLAARCMLHVAGELAHLLSSSPRHTWSYHS